MRTSGEVAGIALERRLRICEMENEKSESSKTFEADVEGFSTWLIHPTRYAPHLTIDPFDLELQPGKRRKTLKQAWTRTRLRFIGTRRLFGMAMRYIAVWCWFQVQTDPKKVKTKKAKKQTTENQNKQHTNNKINSKEWKTKRKRASNKKQKL